MSKGGSKQGSRTLTVLGEFVGEVVVLAVLALLAGVAILAVRGLQSSLSTSQVVFAVVLGVGAVPFVYGLFWTVRVRPGLYFEHLAKDEAARARLGDDRLRIRRLAMAWVQLVAAIVVGYVATRLTWS